ncbi:alpha/beta hydrolase [Candidatus Poribacteria bacterium]|nr:alpha/beta hydrolase [Candidatus Poribacteria bacterium]
MHWGDVSFTDSGGTTRPLLFLHGTGCDSTDWSSVIDYLPSNQRYLTLDFRGHGKTSVPTQSFSLHDLADDVIAIIDNQNISEVILVGHSLGGMVAMRVASRCVNVVGLILLEGWTNLKSAGTAFDTDRFYGTLSPTEINRIKEKSEKTRSRFQPSIWKDFWSTVISFNGYNYLKEASIPIYEVFGEMGRNDATEDLLDIPSNPNIQVKWISDAGHYLPHERPMEVAEICNEYLTT